MNTAIIDTVKKRLTESIDGKVLAASAHFFISEFGKFNILPRHNNIISLLNGVNLREYSHLLNLGHSWTNIRQW